MTLPKLRKIFILLFVTLFYA